MEQYGDGIKNKFINKNQNFYFSFFDIRFLKFIFLMNKFTKRPKGISQRYFKFLSIFFQKSSKLILESGLQLKDFGNDV